MGAKLERLKCLTPEEVLPLITSATKPDKRHEQFGVAFHTNGLRLMTFKTSGLKCVDCGLEGTFFAIERTPQKVKREGAVSPHPYHINLYGLNAEGAEVLFTHDHVLARSLGGKDVLENTQTMCEDCNRAKGSEEYRLLQTYLKAEESKPPSQRPKKLSRRERFRQSAAKREEALTKLLLNGDVPCGKLSATRTLANPEAEAIRMKIVRERLFGNMNGAVDISKNDLKKLNISGAAYVKRILTSGTEADAGSGQASVSSGSIATSANGPTPTGVGAS